MQKELEQLAENITKIQINQAFIDWYQRQFPTIKCGYVLGTVYECTFDIDRWDFIVSKGAHQGYRFPMPLCAECEMYV